jgi:hypothetical protein
MKKNPQYLRTDERLDTEGSLRKAAETIAFVREDPSEWKWILIAVHSAVQGSFVLALDRGNGLLTLKSKHAAAWLKAYRSDEKFTGRLDLDYFGELYRKVKGHALSKGSTRFEATESHDKAVEHLNELRNGFIHFGAKGWSIELGGLPTICLNCLQIVGHLALNSDFIFWQSKAQCRRVQHHLRHLTEELKRLNSHYNSTSRQ